MSLSKHIKDLRRQENLTRQDLADRAGVGIHFVRDLEHTPSLLAEGADAPRNGVRIDQTATSATVIDRVMVQISLA